MLCNRFLRFVSLQPGYITRYTELRQLSYIQRGLYAPQCSTYLWDCKSKIARKMMVDSGATAKGGPVTDILPEKDDDGIYASGGWKR